MLSIRFLRIGKKHQPSFKIVVTDKRRPPRGGRFREEVGFWNPLTKEKKINSERIKYWLSKGAKASDTVYNLLVKEKVIEGKKIDVHKKAKKKPASAKATVGKEEKPVEKKPAFVKTSAGKEEPKKEEKSVDKET